MSKILSNTGLVMEHSKSEVFHFTRSWHLPNPPLDLTSVGDPILTPKPIWRYLGFYFDHKLTFHYHVYYYTTKCISILNAMKLLGNSLCSILSTQKQSLYRTYVLSIALYGFQLWFFKNTPTVKNLLESKKMQCRATVWITGVFCTSPTEGIEALAGLVPIALHLHCMPSTHC